MVSLEAHKDASNLGGINMDKMFAPYMRYFEFSGRSTRSEYWLFTLFMWFAIIVMFVIGGGMGMLSSAEEPDLSSILAGGIFFLLMLVFFLFSLIPALAVTVRRFHDAGFSGWVYFGLAGLSLIPFVGLLGSLGIFVISLLPSVASNKWGDNPHDDWGSSYNYGYERPDSVRYR